ncbi:5' nucleotidase, NT5C type [Tessaracoccus sp.]
MKLIVAVDLDGVTYSFTDALGQWCVTNLGLDPELVKVNNTYGYERWGVSQEQVLEYMIAGVREGTMFRVGPVLEDCRAPMNQIFSMGHHVMILTARDLPGVTELCRAHTVHWLDHEAKLPYDELILSSRKEDQKFDILIDDAPQNVRAVLAADKRAVLLDRPWNQDADDLPRITWPEFPAMVEALAIQIAAENADLAEQPAA